MSSLVYADLLTADYVTGTSVVNSVQSEAPDEPTGLTATPVRGGIVFNWTLGAFWTLNGISELWEYTAATPFSNATKIWEGRANTVSIPKNDSTTRYYWVRVRTIGGQISSTEPATNGLAATAGYIVETFTATDAGPITKSVVAPGSNTTSQVVYVEITHPPDSRVEVYASFRVSAFAGGTWSARLQSFWGTTGGTVNAMGQDIVKSAGTLETITVVGTLAPGSVVGSATRRFGLGVDIFGDGVNNIDVIFRDVTVVTRVSYYS